MTAVDVALNESEPGDSISARPTSVVYETSLGWSEFEDEQFGEALPFFLSALELDSTYADAHTGAGWSRTLLGELSQAESSLLQALTYDQTSLDAHAGLAVVYRDLPDLMAAIAHADSVIDGDSSYTFPYLTSVDYRNVHLIKAQCFYRLGGSYIAQAQAEVDILDPANGLDPDNPSSWVVGGITYSSYGIALLKKIEELYDTYGG